MDMRLSDTLYESAKALWEEAAEKPFVVSMAKGTLEKERFRNYMMQDFLYLSDYIEILTETSERAEEPALKAFLQALTEETKRETERVHIPNMRAVGIVDEDITNCPKERVISEYAGYMRQQLDEGGLIAGLTAMLQCSWAYAYIAQISMDRYFETIKSSPYRSWFEAYISEDYKESNRKWIDVLDKEAGTVGPGEAEKLCLIFRKCAEYENRLWDAF